MEAIKVVAWFRPFNLIEKEEKQKKAWLIDGETESIHPNLQTHYRADFNFDQVISSSIKNKKIYKDNCKDLINRSLEGIDTTIFVYG